MAMIISMNPVGFGGGRFQPFLGVGHCGRWVVLTKFWVWLFWPWVIRPKSSDSNCTGNQQFKDDNILPPNCNQKLKLEMD